jgi:hypothetical protein
MPGALRGFCGGALVRLLPDSARTKNPTARMAVTQKIDRAAFDIFIRVFVSLCASNRICSTEAQLTFCSSAPGYCADASEKSKQNVQRKVTELLPTRLDGPSSARLSSVSPSLIAHSSCVTTRVQHAVSAHGHENTPEVREQIKSILKLESE